MDLLNEKADKSEVEKLKESKLDVVIFNGQKDIIKKEDNFEEVYVLLNQKAEIDHVNKALSEIHEELDTRTDTNELEMNLKNFENVTEALCAEN
eukprot:CAMPEP_0205807948 /NCGR_PEP_ID=MMETSP0205-20121125/11779_1 /ASSEMBLY_ACC=CAM_ASM_000278 /TAXON_ID=36767 /ORGANISM="Euplotes focardii, Strain TN1" /LENGTH=93 /DNA_ID=CAMNT_0053082891 /DNA_START=103 /DNA_END=384 /DNA_ORIENTATION=+